MSTALSLVDPLAPTAVISECGRYRYSLTRTWDLKLPRVAWVLLNPSTANALQDDPTIRRVRGFSQAWGFGSFVVVNLFAWRATSPSDLVKAAKEKNDICGPKNVDSVDDAVLRAECIVAAWGVHRFAKSSSVATTVRFAGRSKMIRLVAARITPKGDPEHPLYLPGELQPVPYPRESA